VSAVRFCIVCFLVRVQGPPRVHREPNSADLRTCRRSEICGFPESNHLRRAQNMMDAGFLILGSRVQVAQGAPAKSRPFRSRHRRTRFVNSRSSYLQLATEPMTFRWSVINPHRQERNDPKDQGVEWMLIMEGHDLPERRATSPEPPAKDQQHPAYQPQREGRHTFKVSDAWNFFS